jgi:hypothetical protein
MTAAYAHKFGRCTISGTMFSGAEEWSTGLQFGFPNADVAEIVPGTAQRIATHWQTFFTTPGHAISVVYQTVEVKLALINLNGKTDLDNIDYYTYPSPIQGGGAGQAYPPQLTVAATMTTDNQRGLASKGRMYIPGINFAIDGTTARLSATYINTLNTGFKAFLDACNADAQIGADVIVASKGHKLKTLDGDGQPDYLDGRAAKVTGCRIGNVYDTQRRRRNGLAETYNAKVLA